MAGAMTDNAASSGARLPLHDLKVLELGHIVAGPTAGQILADLGADVIKVESIDGGDRARTMPGSTAAMFYFLNRNKRSVALDLKSEGKDIFLEMARTADIVIDNYAYGVTDRLGIGYAQASATNPGLIWLSIKGFLPGGPSEAQPMLDELAQMAGGLAYMTGPNGRPLRAGASVIDIGAATYGIIAVLAALRERDAGGRGQFITAGLYETSVYWVAQWMAAAQYSQAEIVPMPELAQGSRMGFGVYSLFPTADDSQVFVGLVSDAHWQRFCTTFDQSELMLDPLYKAAADRAARRPELATVIAGILVKYTLDEAVEMLRGCNVPFAPVRRPDQLADEAHLNQSGQLLEMPLPNGVMSKLPKLPFRATGFDMGLRKSAPALGADTAAVLAELGYGEEQIADLQRRGVACG